MKKRKLYPEIEKYIEHKNALVITGARQVGKTTLLRYVYDQLPEEQRLWLDLENPLHQKYFEELDYDQIYKNLLQKGLDKNKRAYVFLDEIQNFPDVTKAIKYLIDHYQVKFFVTGSSSFYMRNLFPESLSGRKFVFSLYPLDFEEFLYFKGLIQEIPEKHELNLTPKNQIAYEQYRYEFLEYIEYGGFPEVILTNDTPTKKLVLENIFKSFFEKDILRLADYQDVKEIRDLILLLTRRVGQRLDITRLASELGVTRHKIYSYLEFLQATFIIKLISMHSKSIDKKVASGKKVYFLDTGLVNQIAKVNSGELFENTVANLLGRYGELSYYQDKTKEIDFILNDEIAFEVKLTGTTQDLVTLNKLAIPLGLTKHYLISQTYFAKNDNVLYPQFL